MNRNDKRTMLIEIAGVTEAQAAAIEDMLATWVQLGGLGASRWTAFFADGDGNFRPRVTVDGHKAALTTHLKKEDRWGKCTLTEEIYAVDFDRIAWAMRARDESAKAAEGRPLTEQEKR